MSYLRNQVGHIYITMRELKFRFWDSIAKQMLPVLDSWEVGNLANQAERFPVMQYTGLKDKNGEMIFEGDIVKYHDDGLEEDNILEIKWDKEYTGFTAFNACCRNAEPTKVEVIGNIYANPELVND